jgi:transposase
LYLGSVDILPEKAPESAAFSTKMPNRAELTADEWQTFYGLLLLERRVYVGCVEKCRVFLNAVLWILRSGGQWRLLPAALGKWNSVAQTFFTVVQTGCLAKAA